MSTIKHSKYKNTGILFELLVRQITSDILESKESKATSILKKYFYKSELGKEYKLYESLLKNISLTESKANVVLSSLLEISKTLNKGLIKRQKYNLINEIKTHYDLNIFFNQKLPNYKIQAAFCNLLEVSTTQKQINPNDIINNKVTILEHLTAAPLSKKSTEPEALVEFNKLDKDTKILTYKILINKFNTKYNKFDPKQKTVLKELINSVDNQPKLKEFYQTQVQEIKSTLNKLNKDTKDKVVKIKINEVLDLIEPYNKLKPIKDKDLVDLLQYYDLINELTITNG